jgi:hypothetical protein
VRESNFNAAVIYFNPVGAELLMVRNGGGVVVDDVPRRSRGIRAG